MLGFLEFPWLRVVEQINTNVRLVLAKLERIIMVLDDLEAKVTAVQGVEDSAAMLLKTLHDELVAALNDPMRVQAVIDKLAASSDALAAAVAANPDPAPPATPPATP